MKSFLADFRATRVKHTDLSVLDDHESLDVCSKTAIAVYEYAYKGDPVYIIESASEIFEYMWCCQSKPLSRTSLQKSEFFLFSYLSMQ